MHHVGGGALIGTQSWLNKSNGDETRPGPIKRGISVINERASAEARLLQLQVIRYVVSSLCFVRVYHSEVLYALAFSRGKYFVVLVELRANTCYYKERFVINGYCDASSEACASLILT